MNASTLAPPAPGAEGSPPDPSGYVRLASCPACTGRRRVIAEVDGEVRGRCLECGDDLVVPLATERQGPLRVLSGSVRRGYPGSDD